MVLEVMVEDDEVVEVVVDDNGFDGGVEPVSSGKFCNATVLGTCRYRTTIIDTLC